MIKLYLFLPILIFIISCETGEQNIDKTATIPTQSVRKKMKTKDTRYKDDPLVDAFDVNQDGTADMWKIHKEIKESDQVKKIITRREIDINYDGKINYVKFYTDRGNLDKEIVDKNLDGIFETLRYFENNKVTKTIQFNKKFIDNKFPYTINKKVSPFKTYHFNPNGTLKKITIDTDNNNKEDRFLYFTKGMLERIGIDDDSDLKIDRWIKKKDNKKTKKNSNGETK